MNLSQIIDELSIIENTSGVSLNGIPAKLHKFRLFLWELIDAHDEKRLSMTPYDSKAIESLRVMIATTTPDNSKE